MGSTSTLEETLRRAWARRSRDLGLRELLVALMFLFPLAVYLAKFRYLGSTPGDTYPNELLPISLLRDHHLAMTQWAPDPKHLPHYFVEAKGRVVSTYPIVPGLLQLPVYGIAYLMGINLVEDTHLLSLITSSLISALSVVFVYLALRRLLQSEVASIAFALIYAFCTAVWSVTSRGIWQHGPSLLFITASLWLVLSGGRRRIAASGFLLGMAIWNRPTNLVLVAPLAIYALWALRGHRAGAAGFLGLGAIPLLLMSLYSQAYFGTVTALGQAQGLAGFNGRLLSSLLGVLFSPNRGLLVFSPVFLPALLYLGYALFARGVPAFHKGLAISVIAFILLYSKWLVWWGGYCFGYRLLIEAVPFLIIFLALAWQQVIGRHGWAKVAFAVLVIASLYVHFLGAYVYPSGFDQTIGPTSPFARRLTAQVHPERLWVVRDGELVRCTAMLFGLKQNWASSPPGG